MVLFAIFCVKKICFFLFWSSDKANACFYFVQQIKLLSHNKTLIIECRIEFEALQFQRCLLSSFSDCQQLKTTICWPSLIIKRRLQNEWLPQFMARLFSEKGLVLHRRQHSFSRWNIVSLSTLLREANEDFCIITTIQQSSKQVKNDFRHAFDSNV